MKKILIMILTITVTLITALGLSGCDAQSQEAVRFT